MVNVPGTFTLQNLTKTPLYLTIPHTATVYRIYLTILTEIQRNLTIFARRGPLLTLQTLRTLQKKIRGSVVFERDNIVPEHNQKVK